MPDLQKVLGHPAAGLTLGVSSNAWFVLMDTLAQQLQIRGIPTGQIIFLRFILTSPPLGIWLRMSHPDLLQELLDPSNRLLWIRSLAAVSSLLLIFTSLKFLPISDVMALFHLRPFPIAFLCWVLLREAVSVIQIVASVISFGAVLLVIQPDFLFHNGEEPDHAQRALGFIFVVGSMIVSAFDILLVRKLSNKTEAPFMIFVHSLVSLTISPIWMIIEHTPPVSMGPVEILLIVISALLGLMGQGSLVVALKRVPGTTIAVLGYTQIVFAIITQLIFVGTWPTPLAVLGMFIIIAAGVWSVLKGSAPEDATDDKSGEAQEPLRGEYAPVPLQDRSV